MDETSVLKLMKEGNEDALAILKEKYSPYAFKISSGILSCREDQEECVNDAFLKIWNARENLRPDSFKSFFGTTVRNISLNCLKSQTAEKRNGTETDIALEELSESIPGKDNAEQASDAKELSSLINRFLKKQTPFNRSVFIRRYYSMHSIAHISEVTGMSETKITSLLFRMRKSLKKFLAKENYMS